MISGEKLRIYDKFNGDVDGFSRGGSQIEKSSISDQDWRLIDELIQSLTMVKQGLVSRDFEARVRERLSEVVQDEHTREYLYRLSKPRL